jgi:NAD(P)H-hydrate epimerase
MQLLATSGLMQQFDRKAITNYGIPGIVLMENAGRAFVDILERHAGAVAGRRILVVCGKGNNGGDGFVIARHLANRNAQVCVALLCRKKDVGGDARTNLDIVRKMIRSKHSGISLVEVRSATMLGALADFVHEKGRGSSMIVDAIFGTGFSGDVKGLYRDTIEWINTLNCFVASVDIPSGVSSSDGIVANIAVKANLTVTMGLAKIGHYVGEGRDHAGIVEVADISIPHFLFDGGRGPTYRIREEDVRPLLPKRPLDAHKYSVGKVLVIAGSRNLTGAPIMTSAAAMKAGAGAVVLATPRSIHAALIKKMTEVMIAPLDETVEGTLSLAALDEIERRLRWADVVALGPGLSQNLETRQLVHRLVESIAAPLVLDADGLGMMAYDTSLLKKRTAETIITPHVGELRLLTKLDGQFIESHRVEVARTEAKRLNSILVLKGSPTVTGTPRGEAFLNSTGNPGMATAGSGDVLTGIIASFLAQGMLPEEAAYAGVFVHGRAGDVAARTFGQRGMMAMDILDCIPRALKEIESYV